MSIERFTGTAVGRGRAVSHAGLVYAVATAPDDSTDLADQTAQTLAEIDRHLTDAGTDRSRLLSATVYVTNIERKAEMDAQWTAWIGPQENWPQRACVQVGLAGNTLVEIVVVAASGASA